MTLSKAETLSNETLFGLYAAGIIFLTTSIFNFLYVPVTLTFLATLFMCKVFWFPSEAPEAPIMALCRATVNLFFLINAYVLSLFTGSFFARKVTLKDAQELYNRKFVTSDKFVTVYVTYNFVYWITLLVFVHIFRIIENFFTSAAGGIRDKMNENSTHHAAGPAHAEQ